jgi:hypothetical protein
MIMTETAIAPTVTETREYFWIMTVQFRNRQCTLKSTATISQGTTGEQAFDSIREFVAEQIHCDDSIVSYFSLEPNEL